MEINDLISIGVIKKAIGNNGYVTIIPETDFSEHFKRLSEIFLVFPDNTVQSKIIESYQITQGRISLKFENVNNRAEARSLKNAQIMISENELYPLQEDQFYHFQLWGFQVVLPNGRRIGQVDYIFSTNAHDILVINDGTKEIFIPFCDQFIEKILKADRKIVIKPIEGLLDAN